MNKPTPYGPASLRRLLPAITMMMSGGGWGEFKDHTFDGIDIDAEYKLIQQKKSNLSKKMRDMVVRAYERKNDGDKTPPPLP